MSFSSRNAREGSSQPSGPCGTEEEQQKELQAKMVEVFCIFKACLGEAFFVEATKALEARLNQILAA